MHFPEICLVSPGGINQFQSASCGNWQQKVISLNKQQPHASTPFLSILPLTVTRQLFPQQKEERKGIVDEHDLRIRFILE